MNGFCLYFHYALMNVRCSLQYKFWFLNVAATALYTAVDFLGVMILFGRFGSIGEWTAAHTLLCFGLTTTAFGLAEWFSRGFDMFPYHVRSGDFDRMLVRPRTTVTQVLGHRFEINRFGRVLVGAGCTVAALPMLDYAPTVSNALMLLCAVIGGYVLYSGVLIVFAALSVWTVQPLDIVYIFTNYTMQVVQAPLPRLGTVIQRFLTFIFPLGLIGYYPTMAAAGTPDGPAVMVWLALPAGIFFLGASLLFWRVAVRHYHSTGT